MGGMCPKGEDNPNDHRNNLPRQGGGKGSATPDTNTSQSQRKLKLFCCKYLTQCQFYSIRAINHGHCSFSLD